MTRTSAQHRTTRETTIDLTLDLDGNGRAEIATGVGFFDHLLGSFTHHGLFDLTVEAAGDIHIDDHHTVEDVMLVLGTAVAGALGDKTGISRFGEARVPMDEALAEVALDISGRSYAVLDLELRSDRIGTLTSQNVPHVLEAFARSGGITLHVTSRGRNDHHVAEAAFKALGVALRRAVTLDPRRHGVASTKGEL